MRRGASIAACLGAFVMALSGCDLPDVCPEDPYGILEEPEGCVALNSPPQAGISFRPGGFYGVPVVDQTVEFKDGAHDPDGDYMWIEWDFDSDGEFERAGYSLDDELGHHVYRTPGRKRVTMRATDFPSLDGGDSTITETISLKVFTEEEAEYDRSPVADFTATPQEALRGESIRFDASASYDADPDQPITEYHWDFDGPGTDYEWVDDAVTRDPVIERSYERPGPYVVSLAVESEGPYENPELSETYRPIRILAHDTPVADLTADPNPALIEQRVEFDASGSYDSENDIESYAFDLDGNSSFETVTGGPTASRTYFQPGMVRPAVRVTDIYGNSDEASVELRIEDPSDPDRRAQRSRTRKGTFGPKLELPFSASITGDRLSGELVNPPGDASKVEAAARRLLDSRFRSRLRTSDGAGTVETKGLALASGRGRTRICLKLSIAQAPGSAATGGFRIVGGTGKAARLRGRATFRAALAATGETAVVGNLSVRRGPPRGLPRRCARRAG